MSLHVHRTEKVRHLVIRASAGEALPDALLETLRQERVACGWLRASGVLTDVSLRAYGPEASGLGSAHLIAGPVHALVVDGSIGSVDGAPSCSLRAVLGRETDAGLETIAGELLSARSLALEILVTAFDDLGLGRALDDAAGVWLLGTPTGARIERGVRAEPASAATGWSGALEASSDVDRSPPATSRPRAAPHGQSAPMPARPARPEVPEVDSPVPEAGDLVEHFAFGSCQVLKSDGDRLHLRIDKDGRIREIALEMLRVVPQSEGDERPRRFKLERRI